MVTSSGSALTVGVFYARFIDLLEEVGGHGEVDLPNSLNA